MANYRTIAHHATKPTARRTATGVMKPTRRRPGVTCRPPAGGTPSIPATGGTDYRPATDYQIRHGGRVAIVKIDVSTPAFH